MTESEFGVPIPGRVRPPEQWTRTALKKLPDDGPVDWAAIFGRMAPLVVDIGCGNGRFVLGSALRRPELNHLGVDILPLVLRYATRRANQRGLANVRFAACDGWRLLDRYVAPAGLREIHSYHPQPYHERRDIGKRLWTPAFLLKAHQALEPDGLLYLQSDNGPYWGYLCAIAPALFDWKEHEAPWPEDPRGRTRREILARKKKLRVYRGWGRRRDLSAEEARQRVELLPPPDFDAGPRRADLERLERE
ncbi:MAG: methyltransferase domain-containing protein [Gemmataceae bacterium]